MSKQKILIGMLAALCFALALSACAPGGGTPGSNTGAAPTSTPAPINVPSGYQGLVQITFTSATTYDQAVSVVESVGMKLQVQCANPGPIVVNPTPVSTPPTEQDTFNSTHQLTAVAGNDNLTQAMLNQIATSSQVTSVDKAPLLECPLLR